MPAPQGIRRRPCRAVVEPDHGTILDPACGSGGKFVQSAHCIEDEDENPREKVTFCGMEKYPTTIHPAQMNLAVHMIISLG